MKKIIIAASLLTLASCGGNSDTDVTPTNSLNSTEQQLIGTWYLQKQVDSGMFYTEVNPRGTGTDTTVTGYSTAFYITFTSTEFGSVAGGAGANWLQYEGSWLPTVAMTPTSTTGSSITDYWYYDNNANKLNIILYQCSIISISGNQLIVYYNNGLEAPQLPISINN